MLDILTLIPAKYRQWVYAVAGLVTLAVAAWRASDGHWDQALYLLITTAFPVTLAGKNVNKPEDSGDGSH